MAGFAQVQVVAFKTERRFLMKLMTKMRAGDGIRPLQPNFLSPMAR